LTTTEQMSVETAQAMATISDTTAAKAEAATPSNHAAAVVEEGDQETPPQPSPQKKAEPNTITKFFSNSVKKVGGVVADVFGFSPDRCSSNKPPSTNENDANEFAAASSTNSSQKSLPKEAITTEDVPDKKDKEFTTPKSKVDVGQGISSTVEHFPQAESPTMPWKNLWSQMRAAGWVYCAGDLVAWYWVHPSAAKMRKRDMIRDCKDGVHYFSSQKAIQQYAVAHLGWKGEDGNIEFSPTLSESDGRTKKRSRTNAALTSDDTTASPSKKSRRSSVVTTLNNNETAPTKKRSSPRNKGSDDDVAKASQSKSSDSSANSQSSSDKTYIAPPDKQSNVKDKLECCQMVLHPCFKKNQLSKSNSMSVVSSMEDDIKDFMTKSIETGRTEDGMTLPSPGFMYICGGPGTGKVSYSLSSFFSSMV